MNNGKIINVLGTPYRVDMVPESEDPKLKDMDGYTDPSIKRIVVADVKQRPEEPENVQDQDWFQRNIMRHEIIHAFAVESGCQDAFWHSEEMVRWLAYMFPRLVVAFKDAGCLEAKKVPIPAGDMVGWIVDGKGTFCTADEMNYHNSVDASRAEE